jgi:hypothetical protein
MHSFDPADAVEYGILEAVLLANIRWWVAKNASNNKHWYDGHYWTYNSAKAFAKMFPYASQQQIQRALKKLESSGIVHVGNYNSNPYDHTKWYTTPIQGEFDRSHLINRSDSSDQPSITDSKPVVNKKDVNNPLFDTFWKAYPRKTNKGFARSVFAKMNVTDDLMEKMLNAIEVQKRTIWKDKDQQYIPHPSTWLNGERWEDEIQMPAQQRNGLAGAI